MRKRSADEWRALFEAQTESGLTAAQFCRERDICPKYFSLRRKVLGVRTEGAVPCVPASPFVRVEPVMKDEQKAPSSRVRLRLGRCEWELAGLPLADLARLMQALA